MLRLLTFVTIAVAWMSPCLAQNRTPGDWRHDDSLTLTLETRRVETPRGTAVRVTASAWVLPETVERWTFESGWRAGGNDEGNPDLGRARGYRIRFRATREGQPVDVKLLRPGAGPLADRVGVWALRLGNEIIWKRSAGMKAIFDHPLDAPAALYEITWLVDGVPARVERLTLPPPGDETPPQPAEGLAADNSLGIYPPGTGVGVAYPFTMHEPVPRGCPQQGGGLIVASLSPLEGRTALGLEATPVEPVLLGWQADGGLGVATFYSQADLALASGPPAAPVRELLPGGFIEAQGGPLAVRLREPEADAVQGTVCLAPGALLRRSPEGTLSLERGLARVTPMGPSLVVECPQGPAEVNGWALLEASDSRSRAWCVTRDLQIGGRTLSPGDWASWDGNAVEARQAEPEEFSRLFVATCFPVQAPSLVVRQAAPAGAVVQAVLCREVDGANRPVGAATEFPADTASITLLVEHGLPTGKRAQITINLLYGDAPRLRQGVDVGGSGRFVLEFRPGEGKPFRRGKWRVRIEVDGQLDRELEFEIR